MTCWGHKLNKKQQHKNRKTITKIRLKIKFY